jgi:hypothetical protein
MMEYQNAPYAMARMPGEIPCAGEAPLAAGVEVAVTRAV